MPRPSGSIGAMSEIRCFWSTCNQPHRTWSWGSTSDEAPALRSFFNAAVEAKEQEDVAGCQRPVCRGAPVRCQSGRACLAIVASAARFFRYRYVSKLRSGSKWTRFCPCKRPLVMSVTTLAMSTSPCCRSSNCSWSPNGMGSENMVPWGKMGLGQPPDPESKPLRLRISFFAFTTASKLKPR